MRWREDPTRGDRPRPDAIVRPLRPDDIELLGLIQTMCLRDMSSHYTRQHLDAWAATCTEQSHRQAIDEGEHYLIAEMQGSVAGFASWREGELVSTFVVPPAQGLGVGTLIVHLCTLDATAKGTPLTVVRATLNALGFYRALGFLPTESGFHDKDGVRIPYQMMVRPLR